MRCIMYSKHFKTTDDVMTTWVLIKSKYDLTKLEGRNTSPQIFKLFVQMDCFNEDDLKISLFFDDLESGSSISDAKVHLKGS